MGFDPDPELAAKLERLLNPKLRTIDPGLHRVEAMLEALGSPQLAMPPVIHLAGTNGKGSTLAFIRALLEAAGKRVHCYTSPHLVSFNERITLAGVPASKAQLMPVLDKIYAMQDETPTTFFESTTIAAMMLFAEHAADYVLLETGLGGRLDATNVLPAHSLAATVITPVGMDHQDYLGDSIEQIASEKAGILREDVPAFIGRQEGAAMQVIKQSTNTEFYCLEADFKIKILSDGWVYYASYHSIKLPMPSLLGEHQLDNAALALAVTQHILPDFSYEMMKKGITSAIWPARLQPIGTGYWRQFIKSETKLWLDGAHNEMGAAIIADWAKKQAIIPTLIIAMKRDKDAEAYLKAWHNRAKRIIAIAIPDEPDCWPPESIKEVAILLGFEAVATESLEIALQAANEDSETIIICGSLYLAGAVLAKS